MTRKLDLFKLKKGKWLGSGVSKSAYLVKGHPDKVLLVVWDTNIKYEDKLRKRLKNKYKIPVATFEQISYEKFNLTIEEEYRYDVGEALVLMKRYRGGDRCNEPLGNILKDVANKNTISSLEKIKNIILKHKIYIGDLQFLFDYDGKAYVNDPSGIWRRDSDGARYNANYIDSLIVRVKQAMGFRKTPKKRVSAKKRRLAL